MSIRMDIYKLQEEKKILIIFSNGKKKISPIAIEHQLAREEIINEIVVLGHNDSLNTEIYPGFNVILPINKVLKKKFKILLIDTINLIHHSKKLLNFFLEKNLLKELSLIK